VHFYRLFLCIYFFAVDGHLKDLWRVYKIDGKEPGWLITYSRHKRRKKYKLGYFFL